MSNDRRENPRIDFYLPVRIKGHQGLKKTKDFGLGGLFIELEDASRLKQEDEIELIMRLPHEKNVMQVKAKVVRVSARGIGVEFIDLLPQYAMALEYCFHVFKHTVPLAKP